MTHHAWACKQLIFPVALALAFVPVCKAAPQEASSQLAPLLNSTPAQQLVKPPQVTYEDGQLTIIAENSSLSDVMKALRAALGADIELPGGVADQRIWVHLGPGPARRVLRDLLDGTEFNYVMQASESDADGIRSVLLTQRAKSGGSSETTGLPERAAVGKLSRGGSATASVPNSEDPSAEPVASNGPSQATAPPTPVDVQSASANPQNTPPNSDNGASKASSRADEMIQQLQSMYQQRRQIQIQQNQKPSGQN